MLVRGRSTCTPAAVGIRGDPAFQSWLVRTTHAGGWVVTVRHSPSSQPAGPPGGIWYEAGFLCSGVRGGGAVVPGLLHGGSGPSWNPADEISCGLPITARRMRMSAFQPRQKGACKGRSLIGVRGVPDTTSNLTYPNVHRFTVRRQWGVLAVCDSSTEQTGRQLSFYCVRMNRTWFLSLDNHIQHVQEGPGGSWRVLEGHACSAKRPARSRDACGTRADSDVPLKSSSRRRRPDHVLEGRKRRSSPTAFALGRRRAAALYFSATRPSIPPSHMPHRLTWAHVIEV